MMLGAKIVAGSCVFMLAACTAVNPTFGASEATGEATETAGGTSVGTSSGGSSGPSGSTSSDSISSTTLPSSTGTFDSSTSTGTDSSGGADGVGFIEPTGGCVVELPDGVLGHCSVIPCSVMEQDCPDGEACRAWANDGGSVWNSTLCSSVDSDPGQAGDDCTVEGSAVSGIDSCDVGLMCWDVDEETLQGECISYCTGTPDDPQCEDLDETCSITNDGVLALCLPQCDPLLGNCAGDTVCVPTPSDEFTCVPQGVSGCPSGMVDVPPEFVAGCVAGEACCTPYCDTSEGTNCEPETECVPFFLDEPPVGHENLGVCVSEI